MSRAGGKLKPWEHRFEIHRNNARELSTIRILSHGTTGECLTSWRRNWHSYAPSAVASYHTPTHERLWRCASQRPNKFGRG